MIQVNYGDNFELSPHFRLKEFCSSSVAEVLRIPNNPSYHAVLNMMALCNLVLEPLRKAIKRPITINSGFRSFDLNKAVGGVAKSQHMAGEAADIRCKNRDEANAMLAILEKSNINFDQAIVEHNAHGAYWLHVSCKLNYDKNRRKVIRDLLKK